MNIKYIKDNKFKTSGIAFNIYRPLSKEEVTYNALLHSVLRQGCEILPTIEELNQKLDEYFGASLYSYVKKCGDTQIITFFANTISDEYSDGFNPFKKTIELLYNVIYKPLIVNNGFKKSYVENEKNNLKELIESVANDKKDYVFKRLIEEMYKDEPFGIYEDGYVEELDKIDEKKLLNHYNKIINSSAIEIIVFGNYNKDEINDAICSLFPSDDVNLTPSIDFGGYKNEVKYLDEKADISQGKLILGYRTNITKDSKEYFSMMVLNNLFGGAPHSKLFLNVREKLSLAYYASSSYNQYKGLIAVSCGIEFKNYKITLDEIEKQLNEIKNGNVSSSELNSSVSALVNLYRSAKDSFASIMNFYACQKTSNTNYTIDEMIENIKKVTVDDVIKASESIKLDTVFFLKGDE